jgi:hypothetical protein
MGGPSQESHRADRCSGSDDLDREATRVQDVDQRHERPA